MVVWEELRGNLERYPDGFARSWRGLPASHLGPLGESLGLEPAPLPFPHELILHELCAAYHPVRWELRDDLRPSLGAGGATQWFIIHEVTITKLNVYCERAEGPVSEHVRLMVAVRPASGILREPIRSAFRVKGETRAEQSLDFCQGLARAERGLDAFAGPNGRRPPECDHHSK